MKYISSRSERESEGGWKDDSSSESKEEIEKIEKIEEIVLMLLTSDVEEMLEL